MSFSHYEPCPRCRDRGKDSRGDNLAVYLDMGRHCFSCGFHSHPSISSRWAGKPSLLDGITKRILPDDFTWDVPARCWEWLLQYGLPYDYWKGIVGWSEKYQRLVFRVGDPLRFSIGRLSEIKSDSVLRSGVDTKRKWHVWGDSHVSVGCLSESGSITLVEDWISANKVASSGNQVVCLFGTRIYPNHLEYLRQQNKPVILWLDLDQADTMARKCSNLSILTGLPVNYIISDKDPKEYNANQISNYISNCGR